MITMNWIPVGLNWTILFKFLEMTFVVIWGYINKTELNWIETELCQRKNLQWVINTAQHITGSPLSSLEDIASTRCLGRTRAITTDPSHLEQYQFTLVPSGKRYMCLKSRSNRLRNGFIPCAIRSLNLLRVCMLSVNDVNDVNVICEYFCDRQTR